MKTTGRSLLHLGIMLALAAAGSFLWLAHARSWDLGRRSPVLSFDAAQYALAARTLAEQGRLATTFALPLELATHPTAPWPLAVVQPGLVLVEAAIERIVPPILGRKADPIAFFTQPYQREWLTLLLPFVCYLTLAALLALIAARLLAVHAPWAGPWERGLAALTVGGAFLLDAEAQHFAVGGLTELPYTLGLVGALAALASGRAARSAFLFGLLLGVTGAFRGNMLWLVLPLAAIVAAQSAPGHRRAAALLVLAGWALPLLPWWFYKWRHFGSPAWDLSALGLWDGVGGWTWFSLTHLPVEPRLPQGLEAARLLAAKLARNAGPLLLAMTIGPRGLWIGALAVWLIVSRGSRILRLAGLAVLLHGAIALLVAALGAAWLRYLFPARVPLEAAGILATWALLGRVPALGPVALRAARVAVAVVALGWGAWLTVRGNAEARATAAARGVPSVDALRDLGHRLHRELAPGEGLMSNLGPTLSWYSRRPVLHLALTPDDIEACRARYPFRHVVLAFRDADSAWPGWDEVVRRPAEAMRRPEWRVRTVKTWRLPDEPFTFVWLELEPARPQLASVGGGD